MSYELKHGDCLELMKDIPTGSVDMILCDLPYGTTACKWDEVIELSSLWTQYNRIIKSNGVVALFSSQPFTTTLINSNIKQYRYNWYWYKNTPTGLSFAKTQPMRVLEDICVFYSGACTYNKQMVPTKINDRKVIDGKSNGLGCTASEHNPNYNRTPTILKTKVNPRNVLEFKSVPNAAGRLHPTQKPVELIEYLINTYTNEGETVLDNCMGSGTTGVACLNLKRNFIGIEKEERYYDVAQERLSKLLTKEAEGSVGGCLKLFDDDAA